MSTQLHDGIYIPAQRRVQSLECYDVSPPHCLRDLMKTRGRHLPVISNELTAMTKGLPRIDEE